MRIKNARHLQFVWVHNYERAMSERVTFEFFYFSVFCKNIPIFAFSRVDCERRRETNMNASVNAAPSAIVSISEKR